MLRIAPLFLVLVNTAWAQDLAPSGQKLLQRTLAYHNPGAGWMHSRIEFELETGYANGTSRTRVCDVDYRNADYRDRAEVDGLRIEREVRGDSCAIRVDGRDDFSDEVREKHRLTCERTKNMRDYISYLWGLPMKLCDPGTRIDPRVTRRTFQGREVYDLRVTYDEGVGEEIWHMYIDPETSRLTGYSFSRDPEGKTGEYIVLSGEKQIGGARIPAKREWYVTESDEFLGTDVLVRAKLLRDGQPFQCGNLDF